MNSIVKFTCLAFAVTSLTSCGSDDFSSQILDADQQNSAELPLIIGLSGNGSCASSPTSEAPSPYGMDLFENLMDIRDNVQSTHGVTANFIATCYGRGGLSLVSSWDTTPRQGLDEQGVIDYFISKTTSEYTSNYMIAGHSYGGWLAMKFLAANPTVGVNHRVFTIDPISKANCTFRNRAGCTEAPSDISTEESTKIETNSSEWINFWQDQTSYLHSAPITQADQNPQISRSHTGIDNDLEVWNSIEDSFIETM